jgi:tetratricopeptide (TPR) repeat protein
VIHHYGKADEKARLQAKGEAYLRIGHRKVLAKPGDALAHYELGMQYRELERPGDAIGWFQKALALHPHFRDADLQVAICHIRLGAYELALPALRRASRHAPGHGAETALEEGNVHQHLGDSPAAERAFRRALAIQPTFAPASVNLALLLRGQRRLREALACLDEALARNPSHYESLAVRAQTRADLGDDEGALADLDALGSKGAAPRLRARLYVRHRRFAEAAEVLAAIPEPPDAELMALRGAAALGLGHLDEAASELERSLEAAETIDAAMNLSLVLEARGHRDGARLAAARALRAAPEEAAALARFAQLAPPASRESPAPGRPLRFFFYQPRSIPYDARTPRDRGLGGTESAVVYLAEALAGRGHSVAVFNSCEEPGWWGGVEYARWQDMPVRSVTGQPDVLVAVRHWETIAGARFAPLQMFWTGDAYDQPFVRSLGDAAARDGIDFFLMLSEWQEQTFRQHHRVPGWRVQRTTNASAASSVAPPVRPAAVAARPPRLAYASTPFRGLDVLLDLFPRIRAACPGAELDVYSSMRVYGVSEQDDRAQFEALYRKARQPGVTLVGSLPQLQLAARLEQARVLAYPNHYAETFCIAAVEAQAAGCPVLTTALGALPETVGSGGICLPGDPRTPAYQHAFVETCAALLTDDGRWLALSTEAADRAWRQYTWPGVAGDWERFCRAALASRDIPLVDRVAAHLSAGRATLALRMLEREPPPAGVPAAAWEGLRQVATHRAGGAPPAEQALRLVALTFPSIRRSHLLSAA